MALCVIAPILMLFWEAQVPTELMIENLPDEIVARFELGGRVNQRALEAELLAILEEAVPTAVPPADSRPPPQA